MLTRLLSLSLATLIFSSCHRPRVDSITADNTSGKTVISKASYDVFACTTYMIISKAGSVAIADPFKMLDQVRPDIVTVSHEHDDHRDREFLKAPIGRKSIAKAESFTYKDIRVQGLAASHYGNQINFERPNDVIYVFEVDGIRIAHMGDLGQDTLTPEQLMKLGRIDVLIMNCSDLPMAEEKCLRVIRAIRPSVIMTTHTSRKGDKLLRDYVDETVDRMNRIELDSGLMKDGKKRYVRLRQDNYTFLFVANVLSDFVFNPRLTWLWTLLVILGCILVIAVKILRKWKKQKGQ